MLTSTSRSINELIKRIGYLDSPRGQCYGVMSYARQAILLKETLLFAAFLYKILTTDLNEAEALVKRSRQDRDDPKLTPWHQMDILLGKIATYQTQNSQLNNPFNFKFIPQDYARIEQDNPEMLDKRLTALGGIAESSFSGFYSPRELDRYLTTLEQVVAETTFPVAIALASMDHTIALDYNHEQKRWYVFNEGIPNILPSQDIGKYVMECFGIREQEGSLILKTTLFCIVRDREAFFQKINMWKSGEIWQELHRPSKEKARGIDSLKSSWLQMAALDNDTELMKRLLDFGATQMCSSPIEAHVIFLPIISGHTESVRMLAQGMTPEQKKKPEYKINEDVGSLIHLAILYGKHHLIDVLAACGFDLQHRIKGISSLDFAVCRHQKYAVIKLLAYCDLNKVPPNLWSPLDWALHAQDLDIVELLLKKNAKFHQEDPLLLCIQEELDVSLNWILTKYKNRPRLTYPFDSKSIDNLIGCQNLSCPEIQHRKELFLSNAPKITSLYHIACILGKDKIISCFIHHGLVPDIYGDLLYQNLQNVIQHNKTGDQEIIEKAKDCQFMLLCFGDIKQEQISDKVKHALRSTSSGLDSVAGVQNSTPVQEQGGAGLRDANRELGSPVSSSMKSSMVDQKQSQIRVNNPYLYGKTGKTRLFQLFRVQPLAQELQVTWHSPERPNKAITLSLVKAQSLLHGDGLKRRVLDAVTEHLDKLLAEEYGNPATALTAFEYAFRQSEAMKLLNHSQGAFTRILNCFTFYPTDSRRALEEIFKWARESCNQDQKFLNLT